MLTIWSLQLKLHIPGSPLAFSQSLNAGVGKNATFRKGRLGEHKKELSNTHYSLLNKAESEYMPQMGYSMERDCTDPFPAHRDLFRHRPLGFSAKKNESKSSPTIKNVVANILFEDFHGFNLIASEGKVWAIDMSAGEVNFGDAKKLEDIAASGQLFVSETVDGARIAVLSHHLEHRLAQRLSKIAPEADGETRLLEEGYLGYNLVANAGQVWAVEMAAGAIDFEDAGAMEDWLSDGRLLRAATVDGARAAVDRLRDRQNFEAGLSKLGVTLEGHLNAFTARQSEMEQQLGQRQEALAQRLSKIAPEADGETRLLEEGYLGYNLVANAGQVWAVEMAAGAIDFEDAGAMEDWLSDGRLLRAATVDGARAAVDRLRDRQNFEAGLSKLGVTLEGHLNAFTARQSEMEQQLGQRQEALAQWIEDRLVALERPWWQHFAGMKHKKNQGE